MSIVICKDGKEPGVREVVDYLEKRYGMPAGHIRRTVVEAEVGQPIRITVELFWQEDRPDPNVTESEVTQHGDRERVFMRSDGTMRREPRPKDSRPPVVPFPDGPYSGDTEVIHLPADDTAVIPVAGRKP